MSVDPVFGAALVDGRAAALVRAWDGGALRDEIAAERVGPLLAWALKRTGEFASCPDDLRAYLDACAREAAACELLQRRELARLTAALVARGVEPIFFKGAALAYTHYEDPSLRPREDTDLLAAGASLAPIEQVLKGLGYGRAIDSHGRRISHQVHYERIVGGCRHACDVHLKPFNPHLFAGVVGVDEIRASAIPLPGFPGALAPCGLHALLVAVVHRIAHHDAKDELLWLVDVDRLFRATGKRERFIELAVERRVATIAAAGLERARAVLGTPVPEDELQTLRRDGTGEPTARYLNANLLPSDVLLADMTVVRGWRDRLEMMSEHLFPPRAYIAQKYGLRSATAISLAYVWRILRGAPGWLQHRPASRRG